jgi:hypothetical protein
MPPAYITLVFPVSVITEMLNVPRGGCIIQSAK